MIGVRNRSNELMILYDVPKNASSTVKKLLVDHLGISDNFGFYGEEYIDIDTGERISNLEESQRYKEQGQAKMFHDVHDLGSNRAFHDPGLTEKYYRICVVRDPVKRFVSCYNHLALVNKEFDCSPDVVVERALKGEYINNHFMPQVMFLGNNNRFYDKIYSVDNIEELEKDFNNFFGAEHRAQRYQTSGSSVEFPRELDEEFVGKLKELYEEDYKVYGKYF